MQVLIKLWSAVGDRSIFDNSIKLIECESGSMLYNPREQTSDFMKVLVPVLEEGSTELQQKTRLSIIPTLDLTTLVGSPGVWRFQGLD